MKSLYKVFRTTNDTIWNTEYEKRKTSPSKVETPFRINPFNSDEYYRLFYIPNMEDMVVIEKIYLLDKDISFISNELPRSAIDAFIIEQLVEEMYQTNIMEGVQSKRSDFRSNIEKILKESRGKGLKERYFSMTNSYVKLMNEGLEIPENADDILKIYEYLVADEIDEENKLEDGKFRLDGVDVWSGTKIIHSGLKGEGAIRLQLELMLDILKDEDISLLIRIAIGHYIFGYIHPFYDGNGRVGRFLSSIYLQNNLSVLTAISLSKGTSEYRKKYYQAFDETNFIKNAGEMNGFVKSFLSILLSSLEKTYQELKIKRDTLGDLHNKIEGLDLKEVNENKANILKNILFILAQQKAFTFEKGFMSANQIHSYLDIDKSPQTIRGYCKDLVEKGYLESEGKSPLKFSLAETIF